MCGRSDAIVSVITAGLLDFSSSHTLGSSVFLVEDKSLSHRPPKLGIRRGNQQGNNLPLFSP